MNNYLKISVAAAVVTVACLVAACVAEAATKADKDILSSVVQLNESCSGVIVENKLYDKNTDKPLVEAVEEKEEGDKLEPVTKTKVITAKHCVIQDYGFVSIGETNEDGVLVKEERYYYDVDKKGKDNDLALITLRSDTQYFPFVKVAKELLVEQGDEVVVVGHPFVSGKFITKGTFNGLTPIDPKDKGDKVEKYYRASPAVAPGNSGGGLFQKNEEGNYELIGITSKAFPGYGHTGYFVPLDEIKEFLDKDDEEDEDKTSTELLEEAIKKLKEEKDK